MGSRNSHGVRKVARGGKPRLVIDGRWERYRRDASVQTSAGAVSAAQRLRLYAAGHGTLDLPERSPTFGAFVDGQFTALFLPKFRPATRTRYEALLRQGMRAAFEAHRLDDVDATGIRAYAAQLAQRGVQPRGPLNLLRTILGAAVEVGALGTLPAFPPTRVSRKQEGDCATACGCNGADPCRRGIVVLDRAGSRRTRREGPRWAGAGPRYANGEVSS